MLPTEKEQTFCGVDLKCVKCSLYTVRLCSAQVNRLKLILSETPLKKLLQMS